MNHHIINSKVYIAILESVPDYMVPTLVAHAMLSAHLKFSTQEHNDDYQTWLQHSFRKVVLRVNQKEFDKISALNCHLAFESTILDGKMCCAVLYPLDVENTPNVLKFAKMWKPNLDASN